MDRDSAGLRRGATAATALLVALATALVVVPPQSSRGLGAAVSAVTMHVGPDWLVVLAVLWLGDRLVGPGRLTPRRVGLVGGAVFAGALAVDLLPLVPVGAVPTVAPVERAVAAVRTALFPAATVVGVGCGALAFTASGEYRLLPLAPRAGLTHDRGPAAVWRLVRVFAAAVTLAVALEAAAVLTVAPAQYFALALVESVVGSVAALVDYLPVGVALLALLAAGVSRRRLLAAAAGAWAVAFLLGIAAGILARLLGVAAVGLTVTPIPAVESANLVTWPDPLSWDALVTTGAVLAAGVGLWVMQSRLGTEARREVGADPSERGSDR